MKLSIVISALVLAAAVGLGWQIDGRLAVARNYERKLASEAAKLDISISGDHSARRSNRVRIDSGAEARLLVVEFIQLAKLSQKGGNLDEPSQTRYQDCFARISALDASSLKTLIAEVLTSRELEEKRRAERVVFLLRVVLAKKDPGGALKFVKEHSDALKDAKGVENIISEALGNWAKDDPTAAVAWMKNNSAEFSDSLRAFLQRKIFCSAAEKDPHLALTLIGMLGLNNSDTHSALHDIATAATTDEQRNVTLAALREYRVANKSDGTLTQAVDENFGYLGSGFEKEGFAAATRWVASANLSPKELDNICVRLGLNYDGDEPAQWIEWYGHHVPPGKADEQIGEWIFVWTRSNYEAAGRWLASTSEGPVKNAAICSYAKTIFPQEPAVAMQWIKTLPPGEQRQNTLQYIHENYLRNDPEAAAAFKAEHGLK